ncbi:hypothetical protein NXX10_25255 [Bacteroides xylanisolvens]|nr:hypothetical protein [Bacteroides xylanisolvens]
MLYTTNFAFVGLCEAAKATNDSTYVKAVNQMRDFLIRIQVKSDKFRNVDGAWFKEPSIIRIGIIGLRMLMQVGEHGST